MTRRQIKVHHPVVLRTRRNERLKTQLRIADAITSFAGSMLFVYLHAAAFSVWMLFFESTPWPTLTMVVSLEAIFLSTFVMIGQNRQSAFQQAKAGHDFLEQEPELKTNTNSPEPSAAIGMVGVWTRGILIGSSPTRGWTVVRARDGLPIDLQVTARGLPRSSSTSAPSTPNPCSGRLETSDTW